MNCASNVLIATTGDESKVAGILTLPTDTETSSEERPLALSSRGEQMCAAAVGAGERVFSGSDLPGTW